MTRFSNFTDKELDMMEEAFCNEGFRYLVCEIRSERKHREDKKEQLKKLKTEIDHAKFSLQLLSEFMAEQK